MTMRRNGSPYPDTRQPKGSEIQMADGYKRVFLPDHLLASAQGHVLVHRLVLANRIGLMETICHHCGRSVDWFGIGPFRLVVDHLDGDKANNNVENLVPSCTSCNTNRTRNPAVVDRNADGNYSAWWPPADDESLR